MITHFANQGTSDIFYDIDTKAARKTCPKGIWPVARRKLMAIDAASKTSELNSPGMNLEKLKGSLSGYYSIRVNEMSKCSTTTKETAMTIPRNPAALHNSPPTSPGEMLLEEWLKPWGMTQLTFAAKLGIPIQRLNGIIRGHRAVTAETALLFGKALNTTPQFWLNLQTAVDLYYARKKMVDAVDAVQKIRVRRAA